MSISTRVAQVNVECKNVSESEKRPHVRGCSVFTVIVTDSQHQFHVPARSHDRLSFENKSPPNLDV